MFAVVLWRRPSRLCVRRQRAEGARAVLRTGSNGPSWRAALRCRALMRRWALSSGRGAGTRMIGVPSKSRETDWLASTLAGPGSRPTVECACERVEARVVGLLGVLGPPRRDGRLAVVPQAAERGQRAPDARGQLAVAQAVRTFGSPLPHHCCDEREHVVEGEACSAAVRQERPFLARGHVECESVGL